MNKATNDTERFVELIRERRPLWDITSEDYVNKKRKKLLWHEIFCTCVEDFDNLPEELKERKSIDIQRKWRSLRNCYTRELNKQKLNPILSNRKPYLYFDILNFLEPSIKYRRIIYSQKCKEECEEMQEAEAHESPTTKIAEQKLVKNEIGEEVMQDSTTSRGASNETTEEDDDKLFLLSLHSHLKPISNNLKLFAKSDMIQVLVKYNSQTLSHPNFETKSLHSFVPKVSSTPANNSFVDNSCTSQPTTINSGMDIEIDECNNMPMRCESHYRC